MKTCTRCKREKPLDQFHAKTRHPDGTPRTYQSRCKECAKIAQRKNPQHRPKTPAQRLYLKRRRYRARIARLHNLFLHVEELGDGRRLIRWRDREGRRRQSIVRALDARSFIAALERERKADLAAWRTEIRLKEKLRRDRAGAKQYPPRQRWQDGRVIPGAYTAPVGNGSEPIDPAPFLRFLDVTFPGWTFEEIAPVLLIDPRRLREWADYGQPANLHTVDLALTRGLGRPDLLNALYPVEVAV